MTAFTTLTLKPSLLQALEVLEFSTMTPVQEHSLPVLLEGRDVIGQARTGSGKTVAFGLAMLTHVDLQVAEVQGLVLCPTRELADQVTAEVRRLGRFMPNLKVVTLCGGVPCRTQAPSLVHQPHLVIGTPGRVLDHLQRENLDLSQLRVLVLDEADRMLDMGFADSIAEVESHVPEQRQTLLFSATFPKDIRRLSSSFQEEPVEVTVDTAPVNTEIEQTFFEVDPAHKVDAVAALLIEHASESALVFCHTRNDTRDVAKALDERGFTVLALHGEMEQRDRDQVMLQFANRSCSVLVATDVAARGLDVEGLAAVVSYELPHDADTHLHRIGRTGRAGRNGVAWSLCSKRERPRVTAIEDKQGHPVRWGTLPERSTKKPAPAPMVTLLVDGGRQDKLRPGDLLGALTGDIGLTGDVVGKINIQPRRAYIAIRRDAVGRALDGLQKHKIKKRSFRVRQLR